MTQTKIFVVQFHDSKRPHYDFRLELDGVLKSWAVPKEPPTEAGVKRLAVAVDDHDLSYAKFEGEITEGYGKGTVKIWDKGTYDMISRHDEKMVFNLKGKKMKGEYVILKFKKAGDKNWLLFRKEEEG
jgi:DNA ligase D-like protein (predicted 3'-phosphoesterase)